MARRIHTPVRVLLVDDHALLRQHVRSFLGGYATIEVVGEAADGEDALRAVQRLSPDVVVMDIHMPRLNGIAATAKIKQADSRVTVVGLSMSADLHGDEMIAAGAAAVIPKEDLVKRLPETIHSFGHDRRCDESLPNCADPSPVSRSQRAR